MKSITSTIAAIGLAASTGALAGPDGDRYMATSDRASHSGAAEVTHVTATTGFAKYKFNRNEARATADTEIAAFEEVQKRERKTERSDRNM